MPQCLRVEVYGPDGEMFERYKFPPDATTRVEGDLVLIATENPFPDQIGMVVVNTRIYPVIEYDTVEC